MKNRQKMDHSRPWEQSNPYQKALVLDTAYYHSEPVPVTSHYKTLGMWIERSFLSKSTNLEKLLWEWEFRSDSIKNSKFLFTPNLKRMTALDTIWYSIQAFCMVNLLSNAQNIHLKSLHIKKSVNKLLEDKNDQPLLKQLANTTEIRYFGRLGDWGRNWECLQTLSCPPVPQLPIQTAQKNNRCPVFILFN